MQVMQTNQQITVKAERYTLQTQTDRPFVMLYDAQGQTIADFFVASSVHSVGGQDDTTALEAWVLEQHADRVSLICRAQSSIWRSKCFHFQLYEDRLRYKVEVEGSGRITAVDYFGGYCSALLRWGSGYFWSGQSFQQGFNPEPVTGEVNHFAPSGAAVIDLMGVPLPNKGGWFFTPPPFCFAFEIESGWISMGVEARPGENHYCEYAYRGQPGAFSLALDYAGYLNVDGHYTLPAIGIDFARDPYSAVETHCDALRASGLAAQVNQAKPAWWYEPIFCGWGAQCGLARDGGGRAPDYARQENYEGFLEVLSAKAVSPGTVVIDDKWQKAYGDNVVDEDKWPDLPGFVAQQHEDGRKVLLWLKAWDPEGLPQAECVTNRAGQVVAADLTSPAYVQRLQESVERMLSPQGYDADGFKIDFTARIPASPGLKSAGDIWGLELMRRYLPLQIELGVPALYLVTQVDTTGEALEDEDYALLRDHWAQYRIERGKQNG